MNRTLFSVGIKLQDKQEPYFLQFDPDSGSDVSILSRHHFLILEKYFFKSKSAIQLTRTKTKFTAANNLRINFDGYFLCTFTSLSGATCQSRIFVSDLPPDEPPLLGEQELLQLGLITYHPEGKQVKQIKENSSKVEPTLPTIALKEEKQIILFETLHNNFSDDFSGMGLLKGYELDLQLTEEIEFFYRPALVPVHLQDRASERLREYISQGLFEWVPQGEPVRYSSSLLVIEEGTKIRLVGDYRHVNKFIAKTSTTAPPHIETFLDKMRNAH